MLCTAQAATDRRGLFLRAFGKTQRTKFGTKKSDLQTTSKKQNYQVTKDTNFGKKKILHLATLGQLGVLAVIQKPQKFLGEIPKIGRQRLLS
jgi:hypothetical protein